VARRKGLAIVRATAWRREMEAGEAERRAGELPEPEFDADRPAFRRRRGRGAG